MSATKSAAADAKRAQDCDELLLAVRLCARQTAAAADNAASVVVSVRLCRLATAVELCSVKSKGC
jgi:predicted phosphoribosyltransferase